MARIEWTKESSVGVEEFDSHHRHLMGLINRLQDSVLTGDDMATTAEVLAELSNYTLYHFFAEEDAMIKHGYLGYEEQKQEHILLIEKTLTFMEDLQRGEAGLSREVLDFLNGWWRHHVMEIDKQYTPFFHEKGVH
jgi:hemerythrin